MSVPVLTGIPILRPLYWSDFMVFALGFARRAKRSLSFFLPSCVWQDISK